MAEEGHDPVGGVHALHQGAGVQLGVGVGHGAVAGGLLQGGQDLVLHLGGGEADADVDGAQVGDGVLAQAAGDLAAVDEPAPGDVVVGLQRHDFVGGLQDGGAALLRGVARVGGHAVDGELHRPAALAAHHEAVVHEAGLEVEGGRGALGLLHHHRLGVGEHVHVLLVAGEDALDGPAVEAGGGQGLDGEDGDGQAALHVQHAGAVGEAVLVDAEGVFLGGPLLEHGVHVADEEQGGLGAAAVPLRHQHAAGVLHGDHLDLGAHGLQLPADDVVHGGHALQLAGAALGVDHLLPESQHVVVMGVHVLADARKQFLHS